MKTKSKKIISRNPKELAKAMGLSPSDAIEWDIRHSVSEKIISVFSEKSLTITELAQKAGTSRARVTKILKGDSIGISLDVLIRVLGATGYTVNLSYSKVA